MTSSGNYSSTHTSRNETGLGEIPGLFLLPTYNGARPKPGKGALAWANTEGRPPEDQGQGAYF